MWVENRLQTRGNVIKVDRGQFTRAWRHSSSDSAAADIVW
jgi:hypothetical protein